MISDDFVKKVEGVGFFANVLVLNVIIECKGKKPHSLSAFC